MSKAHITTASDIFAAMTLVQLVEVAEALESIVTKTPDERMTNAWVSDEIERRVGVITDAEEGEFMRVYDATNSYLAALKSLRPALAAQR